jgi:hypothetical protein
VIALAGLRSPTSFERLPLALKTVSTYLLSASLQRIGINMEPIAFKEIEADYKHIAADVRSRIVKVAKSNGWGKTTRPAATSAMTRPTTSRATINNSEQAC